MAGRMQMQRAEGAARPVSIAMAIAIQSQLRWRNASDQSAALPTFCPRPGRNGGERESRCVMELETS